MQFVRVSKFYRQQAALYLPADEPSQKFERGSRRLHFANLRSGAKRFRFRFRDETVARVLVNFPARC